jgi:hypothetical protein
MKKRVLIWAAALLCGLGFISVARTGSAQVSTTVLVGPFCVGGAESPNLCISLEANDHRTINEHFSPVLPPSLPQTWVRALCGFASRVTAGL